MSAKDGEGWRQRAYSEIALVADEHDGHVGVGMLPRILQPACQVVECLPPALQTEHKRLHFAGVSSDRYTSTHRNMGMPSSKAAFEEC
jgi:hypothetical protein